MGRRRERGCPCGLPGPFDRCCGPVLAGAPAATAQALMRSRYTAHVRGDAAHLLASWHPSTRPATLALDPDLRWTRLEVVATSGGGLLDTTGTVRFRAAHVRHGVPGVLEELSCFRRDDGRWSYLAPVPGRPAVLPW